MCIGIFKFLHRTFSSKQPFMIFYSMCLDPLGQAHTAKGHMLWQGKTNNRFADAVFDFSLLFPPFQAFQVTVWSLRCYSKGAINNPLYPLSNSPVVTFARFLHLFTHFESDHKSSKYLRSLHYCVGLLTGLLKTVSWSVFHNMVLCNTCIFRVILQSGGKKQLSKCPTSSATVDTRKD